MSMAMIEAIIHCALFSAARDAEMASGVPAEASASGALASAEALPREAACAGTVTVCDSKH